MPNVYESLAIESDNQVLFSSDPGDPTAAKDLGIARVAAGVAKVSNGSSGYGFLQDAGQQYLTVAVTNDTVTMASTTLSATLAAGRKYAFRLVALLSNSTAADGVTIDFGGGTATATAFVAHAVTIDADTPPVVSVARSTALGTDVVDVATITGNTISVVEGGIAVNAAGTFIPRIAMKADTGGTVTLAAGSSLVVWDAV